MNRNIFLLLIGAFISAAGIAQPGDAVKMIAHYDFKFMPDTSKKNEFYTESMVLYTGAVMSIFTGADTYRYDSTVDARMAAILASGQRVSPRAGLHLSNPLATKYVKNQSERKVYTIETFYKPFLKAEAFPETRWNISPETKTVAGFTCQKASARILGRLYEAWFSTDLPFSNGPWKLGGLPGLILEAHDQKGEVFFTCTGFSIPSPSTLPVKLPSMTIAVSPGEYDNLKQAFLEDPVSFFENTPGLVSGTMTGGSKRITSNVPRTKNKVNSNTLELPNAESTRRP